MVLLKVILSLLFFASSVYGNADTFSIGDIHTPPGEIRAGYLDVPPGDGVQCRIPVTVINGSRSGKVLALVAAVHGYEYPPVLALYRLKRVINPKLLTGTVVMVHIANPPSFRRRTIYYNPYDWKNLNRVFPGKVDGTMSERIAYVLTEQVVKKSDFLIDLHCGDGNEALIPYTYWMVCGNSELDEVSRGLALAFGIKYIIIDKGRTQNVYDSKYLANTAILHGKAAITTESGYLGKTDEESIVRNIKGINNVLKHLSMVEGQAENLSEPIWIDRYEVVYSNSRGLFHPLTRMGYYVKKGEKVGYVTDYLGETVQEFRAPFSGMMLYIVKTPPTDVGEPLFEVGRIKD